MKGRINKVGFKPCYKWITFNTKTLELIGKLDPKVLNLVINGLPSIQLVLYLLNTENVF